MGSLEVWQGEAAMSKINRGEPNSHREQLLEELWALMETQRQPGVWPAQLGQRHSLDPPHRP